MLFKTAKSPSTYPVFICFVVIWHWEKVAGVAPACVCVRYSICMLTYSIIEITTSDDHTPSYFN